MDGNWPKGILEDMYDFVFEGYDEAPTTIDTLYEIKTPTQGAFDQHTTAIAMGKLQMKLVENTSVNFRRPSEGYTAYCVYYDFDDGLTLTANEVADIPTNKVKDLVSENVRSWGRGLRTTEEDFAATLFTAGAFTAGHQNFKAVLPNVINQNTGGLAYDGVPFFNAIGNLRSSKGGGTYYNAITANLNVSNYGTLDNLIFVSNCRSERDERVSTRRMGKVVLLYHPNLRDEAVQAIKSEYLPGTDHNDKNPWFNAASLVEWDALTIPAGTGAMTATWYIGVAKQGIRFYRRGKPEIMTYREPTTGEYRGVIRARFGFLPWNWRFWGSANAPTS